ncbi:MAG TPA: hypothetical protein VMA36_09295 [Candidatus Limnocylindria bacterium]|nr:hypothetical protein [Candidatus Limnocylindria bacterium]
MPMLLFALALAGCGGGGGGSVQNGGILPTPAPPAQGAVTQISPTATGGFSSTLQSTSENGTLVIESAETPAEPTGNTPTLPEYAVSANETAGIAATGVLRTTRGAVPDTAQLPYRPRLDPRTATLALADRAASPLRIVPGARAPQSVRRASALAVGTQKTFAIMTNAITGVTGTCGSGQLSAGSSCYENVSAHLLSVSQHAYVWVDDTLPGQDGFTQTDWDTVSTTFDNDFTRETAAFAPAFLAANPTPTYEQCDASGTPLSQTPYQPVPDLSGNDPHISIVITAALDGTGEGGYYANKDLLNDEELNCSNPDHVPSNQLPMFVIAGDTYVTTSGTVQDETFWRTHDMPRSLPHEFQHYLHALNKVIAADFTARNGEQDDAFINEGSSMLAEDLVNPGNAQSDDTLEAEWWFLYQAGNNSLTAFTAYAADPLSTAPNPPYGFYRNTAGSYGESYLFLRYLYDRFGGDAMLHRLYADQSPRTAGTANTDPVVAAAANGETFLQIYGDFVTTLAARGVATGGDARFQFSPAIALTGKKSVSLPGGRQADVVLDGPRSPEDFSSSSPGSAARIKLTPGGGTITPQLIQGATLFVNAAPSSSGATVTGSVTTAAGKLGASFVQGAFDDNGACYGPAPLC